VVGNIIETDMVERRRNKEVKTNQIKNVVRSITNVGAMAMLHGVKILALCAFFGPRPNSALFFNQVAKMRASCATAVHIN